MGRGGGDRRKDKKFERIAKGWSARNVYGKGDERHDKGQVPRPTKSRKSKVEDKG